MGYWDRYMNHIAAMSVIVEEIHGVAPRAGIEPATVRLTAECSTVELPRIES